MRTGVYFQLARGRALVRTKAMKAARRAKAAVVRGGDRYAGEFFPYSEAQLRDYRSEVAYQVGRARRANRDWRRYRRSHVELERD
jgi:hypothetical protein